MATSTSYSEDQFLLRVPPELAEKLNAALDGGPGLDIDIDWKDNRKGTFRVGQESFQCRLQDLPTVTETWKTLDGKNLVKSGDVGQMVLVGQNLNDDKQSANGVTLATRNARETLFKKQVDVDREVVVDVVGKLAKMVACGVSTADNNADTVYEEVWEEDAPKSNAGPKTAPLRTQGGAS